MSLKYCHSVHEKVKTPPNPALLLTEYQDQELERIHKQLVTADSLFDSVLTDDTDTDDSHDLCAAHAQRIISGAICEYI
jgi:hypothetical protein